MAVYERRRATAPSFKGQKSGLPIETYSLDSAFDVKNFRLKEGALQRANGGNTYADIFPSSSGGVISLHRMKNLWIGQRGTGLCSETAEGNATFIPIATGLESTGKLFSSPWRDRLFLTNGTDQKFFLNRDNNTLSSDFKFGNLGFDVSNFNALQIPVATIAVSPGNIPVGTYRYVFTIFDSETNSESPGIGAKQGDYGMTVLSPLELLGPIMGAATVGGSSSYMPFSGTTAFLQRARSTNPRCTHFIVYRATVTGSTVGTFNRIPYNGGQTIFNEIDEFINAGLEFIDNSDSGNDVSLAENNYAPPQISAARNTYNYLQTGVAGFTFLADPAINFDESKSSGFTHTRFFRDQMFGIGALCGGANVNNFFATSSSGAPGVIFNFDSILHGSEVYQPDYWPYIWEVGRGDGQVVTGLGVLLDTALLIFKNKSTYYLSGSSPDNYVLRIMDTNKGCVYQSTIQETPKGVIALDSSGFVLYDRVGQGTKLSLAIQDVIDQIKFEYASSFYSYYDPKDQRYFCAAIIGDGTTPDITFCLDLDSMEFTFDQGYEGLSRLSDTDSDGEYVELQGSASNGRLVSFSNPTIVSVNGQAIESIWVSGPTDFGDDQLKKKARWLYIRARCARDWNIDIHVIPDYNEYNRYEILNYNVDQANSLWYSSDASSDGNLIWDDGPWNYDGTQRKTAKIPVICKGYAFQVRIINRDTDNENHGFAIESVSLEATALKK